MRLADLRFPNGLTLVAINANRAAGILICVRDAVGANHFDTGIAFVVQLFALNNVRWFQCLIAATAMFFAFHDFNIENEPHNVKPLDEIYFAC